MIDYCGLLYGRYAGGAYMAFHKVLEADYPLMTRWFYEVYNIPMYKDVAGELPLSNLPFLVLSEDDGVSNGTK